VSVPPNFPKIRAEILSQAAQTGVKKILFLGKKENSERSPLSTEKSDP
jgi:hypothetical protein